MAATATVRVDPETRDRINELAAARGIRACALLAELVREAEGAQLLEAMNSDFERLNDDTAARERYDAELRDWDVVLLDGLAQDTA
jgi:predicted transcriptional regulator